MNGPRIVEFFSLSVPEQAHWLDEIGRGDWRAAAFLHDRLAEGIFRQRYGASARLLLAVSENGALMGFCTLTEREDLVDIDLCPWIGFVYTFPAYRGHRLSESLIKHVCTLARGDGYSRVYLSSNEIGLYEKYEFEFVRTARDIWGGETKVYGRAA